MRGLPKQATSATMAVVYITIGALLDVWTVVYYFWLYRNEGSDTAYFLCYGFFFTGVVLMAIGFAVGRIGRAAKAAEVAPPPPQQVMLPPQAAPAPTYAPAAPAAPAAPPPAVALRSAPPGPGQG